MLAVALAAISPFILLAVLSCFFFVTLRPLAVRYLGAGFIGGVMAIVAHTLLIDLFAPSESPSSFEIRLGLFGAGSISVVAVTLLPFAYRVLKK